MNEDVKLPEGENIQETNKPVDPFVEKALEMGWRPQEEWDGAPEDFIDAKEYVRRKPLFEKIEHQSKELKQLRSAFEAFKQHHTKVKESEYQRALQQLKDARRQAMADGETERALVLEDKIDEIQEEKIKFEKSVPEIPEPVQPNPEFVRWTQQNNWYGKDRAMTAFADKLGVELHQQGYSPEEVLAAVSQEIKKEFKHKFENPRRNTPSAVEGGTRQRQTAEPEFQMSDEERQIMNKLIRAGAITKDDYIKELKRVRG